MNLVHRNTIILILILAFCSGYAQTNEEITKTYEDLDEAGIDQTIEHHEDIIQKYWFKSGDKLSKAKSQGDIKWMPENKPKSIAEMSDKEYAAYKAKMGIWTRGTFS